MDIPFVDLKTQYETIRDDLDRAVSDVLRSSGFILGPSVERFEKAFSEYCSARECIGVSSGSDALFLSLKVLGVGPGDDVITVPNTFIATVDAIRRTGANPVFVDVEEKSFNMDPEKLGKAVNEKTRAVIPVHLYGQPAEMDPILEIAEDRNLKVVEDACQAHGAEYRGKRTGSLGDLGCFSFYPSKNLGALGDGGAIVTSDPGLADKLRMIRDYGQRKKNEHEFQGYNSRLDSLHAAVLSVKLKHLDEWNSMRRKNADLYSDLLSGTGVEVPDVLPERTHSFHLYVISHENRDRLMKRLSDKGISTGIHYPKPVHLQKAYEHLGYGEGSFPVSERLSRKILSLPMYPELSREQIESVCNEIEAFGE